MNVEQVVALSDASEHLVYALLADDASEISKAREEIRIAKEMSSGKPSADVIAQLIKNDPENALHAGLINKIPE